MMLGRAMDRVFCSARDFCGQDSRMRLHKHRNPRVFSVTQNVQTSASQDLMSCNLASHFPGARTEAKPQTEAHC